MVQIGHVHGLGVLVAKLEDVSDFNTSCDLQRITAEAAAVPFPYAGNVHELNVFKISRYADVLQVVVGFVGTANHVLQTVKRLVEDHLSALGLQAHRTDKAEVQVAF